MKDFFWLPPAKEITHPPITDKEIAAAEKKLAVKLPAAYIEIIKVQNGGSLRYETHPSPEPNNWAEDHVFIDQIMGIGSFNSILDSPRLRTEWQLPENIILFSNHGHYWTGLDYRACGPQGEPAVVWIDSGSKQEVELAPDFATFLDGLVHGYHCHVFGFHNVGEDPDPLLKKIAAGFGFPLKKGVTGAYFAYHPDWRAIDNHSRATLLLSRNRSAAGDYRYPFHPECDWLLICNIAKDNREIVEAILQQSVPFPSETIHVPPWGGTKE